MRFDASDLRQALYDEGAILMKKVLVNLHGDEHLARKRVVTKILRPAFFLHYEKNVFGPTLDADPRALCRGGQGRHGGVRVSGDGEPHRGFCRHRQVRQIHRGNRHDRDAAAHVRQGRHARSGARRSRRDPRGNPARPRRVRHAILHAFAAPARSAPCRSCPRRDPRSRPAARHAASRCSRATKSCTRRTTC